MLCKLCAFFALMKYTPFPDEKSCQKPRRSFRQPFPVYRRYLFFPPLTQIPPDVAFKDYLRRGHDARRDYCVLGDHCIKPEERGFCLLVGILIDYRADASAFQRLFGVRENIGGDDPYPSARVGSVKRIDYVGGVSGGYVSASEAVGDQPLKKLVLRTREVIKVVHPG